MTGPTHQLLGGLIVLAALALAIILGSHREEWPVGEPPPSAD